MGAQDGQGRGGGHREAQAEAARCQCEGKKTDPEGQEPLSSLHKIWRRKGGEKSGQKRLISLRQILRTRKKSYGINAHSHPPPESWQEGLKSSTAPGMTQMLPCPSI